jgi:hypothetical protein
MLLKSQLQHSTSNQANKLLQNKELLTMSNEEKPNNEEKSNDRPKLKSINGNNDVPTVTPKIRRIAQPGDVLFPRGKVEYCPIKSKSHLYHQVAGFCESLGASPKPKKTKFSLGKGSLKVNFNLQAAKSIAAHKGASKNV